MPGDGGTTMADRADMTRWYSVPRLASIGVRVAISTVFGEFADRRESMVAERPLNPAAIEPSYDYAAAHAGGNFWLDFVADTGDGWDSTYAVARLLAMHPLAIPGCADSPLPRARVLVMGGDQVYPTPSEDDYRIKLVGPFRQARNSDDPRPDDVYAVPGNHDWYDGLSAFMNLFCWRQLRGQWSEARNGKRIGGWRTQQTRSYFALKLPEKWWLWAIDVQLTTYIDQQQMNYFEHIARQWMDEGDSLILCTAVPHWVYADPQAPEAVFSHFSFIEGLLSRVGRRQKLRVILTGDSHHYSRYTEDDRHYITAGGGGAFLHPTHQLPDRNTFAWQWPRPNPSAGAPPAPLQPGQAPAPAHRRDFVLAQANGVPATFPSRAASRRLAWGNLAFAGFNWDFALALGCICAIFAWQVDAVARFEQSTLPLTILAAPNLCAAFWAYLKLVFASPWPPLMIAAAAGAYYYLADFKPWYARLTAGLLHTAAQTLSVVAATLVLPHLTRWAGTSVGLIILVGIAGGVIAATVMGLYFLISLNGFGKHWNEAFSSMRIKNYKNFLRLRIAPGGRLTIYPIGLRSVPKDRSDPPRNPPLAPALIEPPIHVS
jgi:hypothetical protein